MDVYLQDPPAEGNVSAPPEGVNRPLNRRSVAPAVRAPTQGASLQQPLAESSADDGEPTSQPESVGSGAESSEDPTPRAHLLQMLIL